LCDSLPHSASQPLHISLAELSLHNTDGDCWTAIRGKVYNVTRFLKYHPGRKAQLMRGAGVDSTKIYDKVHSWVNEEAILQKFFCGYLTPGEGESQIHVRPQNLCSCATFIPNKAMCKEFEDNAACVYCRTPTRVKVCTDLKGVAAAQDLVQSLPHLLRSCV
jgi:hypothetical protein